MTAVAPPPPVTGRRPPPRDERRGRPRESAVLVTGAACFLGRGLATRLEREPSVERVVGVDLVCERGGRGKLDLTPFDLVRGDLARLLAAEQVRQVIHLQWLPTGGRRQRAARRLNAAIASRLAEAVLVSPGVRSVVLASSAEVYRASPQNPCFLRPQPAPEGAAASARGSALREAEAVLLAARAGRPGLRVALVRLAPVLGSSPPEPLDAHLARRLVPTALGFDPRIQALDAGDAVEALARAALAEADGVVHVAAPGILPLHRVLRLLGRTALPLPRPALGAACAFGDRLGGPAAEASLSAALLRFPPTLDIESAERDLAGFRPRHTLEAALRALALDRQRDRGRTRLDGGADAHAHRERARLQETLRRALDTR